MKTSLNLPIIQLHKNNPREFLSTTRLLASWVGLFPVGRLMIVTDYGNVVQLLFKPKPGAPILLSNPVNPPAGSFNTS